MDREQQLRKAAITRRIKAEVLAKYELDRLPKHGDRDLITGAQGTGKSHTVAENIAAMQSDVVIWWMVPTLEKAAEQADEYSWLAGPHSLRATVVRGRGAPDPVVEGEAMCPRHQVVNRAASMGVEVQQAICKTCALNETCGFQVQRSKLEGAETGLFIMAADYLWLPCPAPRHDIVVVDESVLDKATETVSFGPSRITEDDKWSGGELEEATERRRIAMLVRTAITRHPSHELAFLRDNGVTISDIRACTKHLATREEAQPHVDGKMTDKEIADRLDAVEARETLKVLKLFRQIRREFEQPRARLNSVWFDPEARVRSAGRLSAPSASSSAPSASRGSPRRRPCSS